MYKTVIAQPFAYISVKVRISSSVSFPYICYKLSSFFGLEKLGNVYYFIKQKKNIAAVRFRIFTFANKLAEIKVII